MAGMGGMGRTGGTGAGSSGSSFFDLSGLNPGIKIGNALRDMLFGNRGMIIKHRVPGRRRYSCEALRGQDDLCARLEQALNAQSFITSARVNPVLGTVTVSYSCEERQINALFDALSHELAGKHAQQETTLLPTGMLTAGDNLNDTFQNLKQNLSRFLNHSEPAFFVRIAGMALLGYGLYRIMSNGEKPAGPQLALWGLALLLRRSHPEPVDSSRLLSILSPKPKQTPADSRRQSHAAPGGRQKQAASGAGKGRGSGAGKGAGGRSGSGAARSAAARGSGRGQGKGAGR